MSELTTVTFDASRFEGILIAAVNDGLAAAANVGADTAKRSFGSNHGGAPSSPGSPPNSQTGRLRNSVMYAHPDALGTPMHAAYGTAVEYGRHLEHGATVTAKRTKYLPVPVNAAARKMATQAGNQGVSLRTLNLTLVVDKAKRQALLVEKTRTGRDKKNGAVFVLKKSVRIAARPWLRRSADDGRSAMEAAFVEKAKASMQAAAR